MIFVIIPHQRPSCQCQPYNKLLFLFIHPCFTKIVSSSAFHLISLVVLRINMRAKRSNFAFFDVSNSVLFLFVYLFIFRNTRYHYRWLQKIRSMEGKTTPHSRKCLVIGIRIIANATNLINLSHRFWSWTSSPPSSCHHAAKCPIWWQRK